MRRVLGDALISLGSVLVLLVLLVSVDPRVREQVTNALTSGSPTVHTIRGQARAVSSVVISAARDHSIDQAPLMIFAVAATVLVVVMLRT